MADFTVDEVNFEQGNWICYRRFIERLRNLISVRHSHNCPVTPIEVNPPTRFFDVRLATNNHNITVRFRRDNLYLVGYRMQGNQQWLELLYDERSDHNQAPGPGDPPRGYNPQHRIPGAQWLSFGDQYRELSGGTVRYPAPGPALTTFEVGRQDFIDAIDGLAASTNNRQRARSLIVLAIMISESVRFSAITTHFDSIIGRASQPIPGWIDDYIRGWGDLSASMLRTDFIGLDDSFGLPFPNNFGIQILSVAQALAIIGIVKGYDWPRRRHRRAADDNIHNGGHEGRPLVELFSVTIDNIHGNQNIFGDIYGTIKVSDGLGHEYMYNRKSNDSESIRMGNSILLNGPSRCLSAYDNFTIDVALMNREGLSEDDEISKGQIACEVTYLDNRHYDKLLTKQVKGRFGSATLSYAILRDAVVAMVEVMLITNNGEPTDVYGLLTSHNATLNSESVLFHKANNKFVNVRHGKLIPLSRSVVAVPLCSNFIVRADLKGSNIFSSDDKIAKGIATFTPQLYGTHEETVNGGKNRQIQVKVTWSWYV